MKEPPFWVTALSPYSAIKVWALSALTAACARDLTLERVAVKRESRVLWGLIDVE